MAEDKLYARLEAENTPYGWTSPVLSSCAPHHRDHLHDGARPRHTHPTNRDHSLTMSPASRVHYESLGSQVRLSLLGAVRSGCLVECVRYR